MWKDLFNKIAPVYGMFFEFQVKNFRLVLQNASTSIDIPKYTSFLDIGCGTGALCFALSECGYRVTGVDAAPQMIKRAKEHNANNETTFVVGDVLDKLAFDNKSFDVVIASYVAHGMYTLDRRKLYDEAARLAKTRIIFQDYNQKRARGSDLIEWLEGGDYFNFIKIAEKEMKEHFGNVRVIPTGEKSAWYVVEV